MRASPPRIRNRNSRFARLLNSAATHKHVSALVVALAFGLVGSSLVFLTNAFGDTVSVESEHPLANNSHTVGESFNLPFTGSFDISGGSAKQVNVLVSYAGHHVQPRDPLFTCGVYECARSTWAGQNSAGLYTAYYVACFDVPAGYHPNTTLFTTHWKATTDLQYGGGWLSYRSAATTGTCASNPSASGITFGGGEGGCAGAMQYACEQGPGPGRNDTIGNAVDTGNQAVNNGNKDKGTGNGGGGGGGSSAKTQSDQPNTIPASTNQGDNKQPEVQPSPFFDGKQYATGSDPDKLGAAAFSVGGRKVIYGWLYLLVAVLIVSVAGYYFWRRRGLKIGNLGFLRSIASPNKRR